jgi:putative glycosyltransferase (TIGR04372 family)
MLNNSSVKQRFLYHSQQVKTDGWLLFARKVRSLSKRLLFLVGIIAATPLVLLIVAIRPFVLLRFGTMTSQRIGHFAGDVEAYLCACDREKPARYIVDIIGCPEPVCNRQLQKMWERTRCITSGGRLWGILDRSCRLWTRGDAHHVNLFARNTDYRLFLNTEPHLSFTNEEHQRGRELLKQLGIPAGASWVCIHNRDAAYLDKAFGGCYDHHDYRNFSVQTMVSAAEELSRRGYYVVRVGSIVAEAINSANPRVIDYANSPLQSDFMDIYLLANGAFLLGNDAGIFLIPTIFRKPVAMVNFTLLMAFNWAHCPIILKRAWHKERQRFLSLRDLFEMGLSNVYETYMYEKAGVELICNTPEEILDLAVEVDERLKGNWQPQPGDEELQQRFWAIFRKYTPSDCHGEIQARIGANFLRKHPDLLN